MRPAKHVYVASLGYGRIGQAVAERARAFGTTIRAIRRDATRPVGQPIAFLGGPDALDEVLRRADHLVVTLSLTPTTRGLLGTRELGLMKPTALLVNVARGEISMKQPSMRRSARELSPPRPWTSGIGIRPVPAVPARSTSYRTC